jgi:uncharacterized delta-60 repeat protein
MSRLTRVRSVSRAVSREVARMWHRLGERFEPRRTVAPYYRFDPLESRIMLANPTVTTPPDQSTDEGKTVFVSTGFFDPNISCCCACLSYTASINWGDGCTGCVSVSTSCSCAACGTISGSHVYADNNPGNANYTATITLSDGIGSGQATFHVKVYDVPPTLTMGGAATVNEGANYTLTLAHSDPGPDALGNWNIQWGDGGSSTPAVNTTSTTHAFVSGYGHPSITVTNSYTSTQNPGGPFSAHTLVMDTSGFGSGGKVTGSLGRVQALTTQSDGKILAAFGNGGFGIDKDFILARYTTNGALDSSFGDFVSGNSGPRKGYRVVYFGSNSGDYASSIAIVNVNGTDRILVAGSRTSNSTGNDFAILRFNALDGSLDSGTTGDATLTDSFGTGGKATVNFNGGYDYAYGMAIQGDKIVLAGSAETATANNFDFALARLNADGSLDTTFGDTATGGGHTGKTTLDFFSGASNSAYDVKIVPFTNQIIVVGTTTTSSTPSTGNDMAVARYTPDGQLDTTFGKFASGSTTVRVGWNTVDVRFTNDNARAALIQDDGKIVIGGSSEQSTGNMTDFALARFNADGTLDDGSSNDSTPNDRFGSPTTPPNPGTVMTNFLAGSDEIMDAVMQINGRLVAVGYSTTNWGQDFAVARYMPDGTLDNSFGNGGKLTTDFTTNWACTGIVSNDVSYAAALQADGKILAGGIAGTLSAIVRYQPQDTLDVWVIPNAPSNLTAGTVSDASVQLSWTDNSSVETGFVIQRADWNGTAWTTWADVGTAPASANTGGTVTYQAAGLNDATSYKFRVFAVNGTYRSNSASNEVTTGTAVKSNPDYAEVGQVVHLRAPTGGSSSAVYTWNVYKGDQQFATGTGSTFDFTPDAAGTYSVVIFTQDGSTNTSSTQTITVKDTAPQNVKITGPSVVPLNRVGVFTASAGKATGSAGSLHYQWSVEKLAYDDLHTLVWTAVSLPADTLTDLPSFRFTADPNDVPSGDTLATYRVHATLSNDEGQSATVTKEFIGVDTSDDGFMNGEAEFTVSGSSDASGLTKAVAVQPYDDKIVVAGGAGWHDSSNVLHFGFAVARFNPGRDQAEPGAGLTVDPTFGTNGSVITEFDPWFLGLNPGNASAMAVAVAPDHRIIAVGEVPKDPNTSNAHVALGIVAYNPDGTLDTSFGPSHNGIVVEDFGGWAGGRTVVVQADGKIVVGGWYHHNGDVGDSGSEFGVSGPHVESVFIARYNADGTPDTNFGNGGAFTRRLTTHDPTYFDYSERETNLTALALQADGKIVGVGGVDVTGQPGYSIERFNPGSADPSQTGHDFFVLRVNTDGTLDNSFGGGVVRTDLDHASDIYWRRQDFATSVVIQPDQKILVGGWTGSSDSVFTDAESDLALTRYNPDGSLDQDFGSIQSGTTHTGKLIDDVGGSYPSVNQSGHQIGWSEQVNGIVLQSDGKIIVSEDWYSLPGRLVRYNSDGSFDNSFDKNHGHYTDGIFGWDDHAIVAGADGIYVGSGLFQLTRFTTSDAAAVSLTATARVEGPIDLRWQDAGGGEDGFGVERWDPASRTFVDVAYVGADVTNFTDTDVLPGNTYRYRVYAFVGDSVGGQATVVRKGQSNEASATTFFPNDARYKLQETVPVPVDGTHVQSLTNLHQSGSYMLKATGYFNLSPADDPGGTKHADAEYGLFRPTPYDINPYSWHVNYGIAMADLGLTDHHDLSLYWGPLAEDTNHTYRIGYVGNGGKLELWYRDDLYGDNQTVTDGGGTHPYNMLLDVYRLLPQAPSHLTATPDPTSHHITLKWQSNTTDEMYFQIQRSDNGGSSWTPLVKVAPGTTSYTDVDSSLALNHQYSYRVLAHTATDDSPYSNQAVTVLLGNRPPVFDTISTQTVVQGKEFIYRVHAFDPDQPWLKMTYSLEGPGVPTAPNDMQIDSAGYIHNWVAPTGVTSITVTVRATNNPNDSTDTATAPLTINVVSPASTRPTISTATATFDAAAGNIMHLTASASENGSSNGITYTWSTVMAPDDAKYPVFSANNGTSDASSATATFAPGSVTGIYIFNVTATDAAGNIETSLASETVRPIVTTLRIVPRHARAPQNTLYPFFAVVQDQFGHDITGRTLHWRIDTEPEWTDNDTAVNVQTNNIAGRHTLSVYTNKGVAPDDRIDDSVQFENLGIDDRWPVIGKVWARPDPNDSTKVLLSADATDDVTPTDNLTYTWTLEGGGAVGVGKQVSTTVSSGTYQFRVTVTDGGTHDTSVQGPAPYELVTFNTQRVLTSLVLVLTPPSGNVAPGTLTPVTVEPKGKDQYGDDFTIDKTQVNWTLNGAGSGVIDGTTHNYLWTAPSNDGIATLTANIGSAVGTASLKAVAQAPPVVKIFELKVPEHKSTESGSSFEFTPKAPVLEPTTIDRDTDVYVSVDDPNDDPVTWSLTAVPADGGSPIPLASGSGELGVDMADGQKIATIHPLLLPQGLYTLTLTAKDAGGAGSDTRRFVVKTPLKLGNFTLPVTDLTVQGHGLPITISRVYDSSRSNKYDALGAAGDFGPGWRLAMPDTDMQVTAMARATNKHDNSTYPTFMPGDAVFFTLPDGQVEGFEFDPQPGGLINGIDYHLSYGPSFRALNGSTSRLTVDPDELPTLIPDGDTGEFADLLTGHGYNPARPEFGGLYYLTTHDGTQYVIDAKTGIVQTVTDPNGNMLKYNLDGNGRLSSIESYNTHNANDKTKVWIHRNADGRIHWIEDDIGTAADPNETQAQPDAHSVVYAYKDNFGDTSTATPTHPGELASFTDRAGNKTQYGYDDKYTPTVRYHLTTVTDPRSLPVLSATYSRDTGEMTALKDPYKKTAQMGDTSFAGADARKSVKDLAGDATEMEYDPRGRPVREIREVKDASGKLTGYRESVTKYEDQVTDDNEIGGLGTVIKYRPFTLPVAQKDQRHDFMPSVDEVASTTVYDRQGNVVQQIDAAGRTTTLGGYTTLASDDHPVKPTDSRPTLVGDAYGNHTNFDYDSTTGNLDQTTNAADEQTCYTYDTRGNVTQVTLGLLSGTSDDVPTSQSEYNGPDGQISKSKSDFRKNGSNWVPMSERDYDYTPATIGGVSYRQEKVTLKWRDTPQTADADRHSLVESVTLYDADDRTWKVTDANGKTTETQYDSLGQVAVTIDPFGGRTSYDYDVRGNLIRTLYPDGTETRTVYDELGRVTWQTDRYASNSNGLTGFIDNATPALDSLTIYDDLGQVIESRRYKDVLVRLDNDLALGQGVSVLTTGASGGTLVSTTSTQYDDEGRPYQSTDAAGVTTTTSYYDDGRTKGTQQRGANIPVTPGPTYAYDFTDSSGLHREDRVTDALNHTTTTDYDELGQAVKVTYADGPQNSFTETLYGMNSQPVIRQDITLPDDPGTADDFPSTFNGQHVVKIAQRKDGEPIVATHYLYDTEGRLTDVWQPPVTDADPNSATYNDTLWPHWKYTYDGLGNLASITNPKHHVTNFNDTYATSSDAPLYLPGQKKTYTRTLPAVNNTTVTETTTYDSLGRTLKVQDFKGQTTAYAYDDSPDGQGRLFAEYRFAAGVTATDSSNTIVKANAAERTEYSYDALGRQSQVREYASGTGTTATRTTNYSYDSVTGAISLVDSPEGKVHHEYDPATGRLTETWTGTTHDSATTDTLYGYDQLGRLASVASAKINGSAPAAPAVQRNRFNAAGAIVSGNTLPTTTYDYDAVGNLDHVNLPNGDVEEYHYDDLNRLDTLTASNSSNFELFEQDYTLSSNGRRSSVLEKRFSGSSTSPFSTVNIGWSYDDLGRLTGETRDEGNNGQDGEDYVATYAYDLAGNRMSKVFDSADAALVESVSYAYDARDRLTDETSSNSAHDVHYTYDRNGSLTQQVTGPTGGTQTTVRYLWDLRNRLVAVDGNGDDLSINSSGVTTGSVNDSSDTTYGYDNDGVRVSKTTLGTGGSTILYLSDPANPSGYSKVLEEKDTSGNVKVTYVLGHEILGQAKASESYVLKYLLKDGHGTTRALLSRATGGAVLESYDFQAFGEPIGFTPSSAGTNYFQPDGATDVETSFTYSLARYRRGFQFISSDDPAFGDTSDPLTLHTYLYTANDPINHIDLSGHDMTLIGRIVVNGLGLALTGALLGVSINGVNNFALGHPFFEGWKGAALFGAAALPLSVAFPVFGMVLAGMGVYGSTSTAYKVFTNPNSTASQKGAAIFLVGLSLFGFYKSGQSVGLWANPAYLESGGIAGSGATTAMTRAIEVASDSAVELKEALAGTPQEGRVTMAVGVAEDAGGNQMILIGTSEPSGYIRPQVRPVLYRLSPNVVIKGGGHAESDVVAYCKARGWKLISIGATRPICDECAQEIAGTGATAATPVKNP